MKLHKAVALGFRRHRVRSVADFLAAYGVLWSVVESLAFFFPEDIKPQGKWYYGGLLLLAILFTIIRAYPRRSVQFKAAHSNTRISVLFGDVFERSGVVAIPGNEFFDSQLGLPVSPSSLHGIVLNRFYGGQAAGFDQLVSADLSGIASTHVARTGGVKEQRFPIGTTANIKTATHSFLLFALCETDLGTLKASSTLPHLVRALEGLCAKARLVLGGEKLVLPLVGSGLSGIGLPANQLLHLILIVLVNETKKNRITAEIEVVLHESHFDDIDLSVVETTWRN